MTLYHGTNCDFEEILLDKCLPYKDFGQGFYLTDIREQAERMAQRKSRREGSPVILEYNLNDEAFARCRVLRFNDPDIEWVKFILANRKRRVPPFQHPYDIVIGPVADDGIAVILAGYQDGTINLDQAIEELKFKHLNSQYCFCTPKAVAFLKRMSHE